VLPIPKLTLSAVISDDLHHCSPLSVVGGSSTLNNGGGVRGRGGEDKENAICIDEDEDEVEVIKVSLVFFSMPLRR